MEETPEARPAVSFVSSIRSGKGAGFYVAVQAGDTLSGLAQTHGVTVADICRANGITPKAKLSIGQELHIVSGAAKVQTSVPTAAKAAQPRTQAQAPGKGSTVVIQAGDTLYSLARTHNTSIEAITKRNGITPKTTLKLGQVLYLP